MHWPGPRRYNTVIFKVNAVVDSQRHQQRVADWKTTRADGPSYPDGRGLLGGNLSPINSRADDRIHGVFQQPIIGREAQGSRVPDGGVHELHASLRHW